MSRYTNNIYIRKYLVMTLKKDFSIVCYCINWVSKFHNFFDMLGNGGKGYVWEFLILPFMESSIKIF